MLDLRDPVSSGSHLLMCGWAVLATLALARLTRHDPVKRACLVCWGCCLVYQYATSGLFHGLRCDPVRLRFYQLLDQGAIYCVIAGTYTPMIVLALRGWFRAAMFALMWGLTVFCAGRLWLVTRPDHATMVGLYFFLASLGQIPVVYYVRAFGRRAMLWGWGGGLAYAAAGIMELSGWPTLLPGVIRPHEVFHLGCVVASLCHFVFMARYMARYVPPAAVPAPARHSTLAPARAAGMIPGVAHFSNSASPEGVTS